MLRFICNIICYLYQYIVYLNYVCNVFCFFLSCFWFYIFSFVYVIGYIANFPTKHCPVWLVHQRKIKTPESIEIYCCQFFSSTNRFIEKISDKCVCECFFFEFNSKCMYSLILYMNINKLKRNQTVFCIINRTLTEMLFFSYRFWFH